MDSGFRAQEDCLVVVITQVKDPRGLKKFIRFPFWLYRNSKYWVPPLLTDEFHTLSPDHNPAFEHCEAAYWLASVNGLTVGRIAGIINHKFPSTWGKKWARFGWIDFIDDHKVSAALLGAVEGWAASKGMEALHGPMGFCGFDREGMLIKGFDELGTMATIYNYPYYPVHLERLGYVKDTDMVEYEIEADSAIPERIERVAEMVMRRGGYRLADAKSSKDLLPYADEALSLLNEAYGHLYGAVPLSEGQKKALVKQYFSYLSPDLAKVLLDREGRVVAFGIAMPSLSKALQKARGRLIPFGFIHVLWALKWNDRLDLYLIAVRPDLQGKGLNAVIMNEIAKNALKRGMTKAETNPEWEENERVQSQWKSFSARQHKTRRIYVKHLHGDGRSSVS
jgi:GNAT superfamily N-acetyltransferase